MTNSKIFISYAHQDKSIAEDLRSHLRVLERTKSVEIFYDANIKPGEEWDRRIRRNLEEANIIVFIVSANFLASDYTYGIELQFALDRQKRGLAKIIPVIARACDWESTPFGQLQVLPSRGRPITSFSDPDEAYLQVVQTIRYSIDDISSTQNITTTTTTTTIPPVIVGDGNVIIGSSGDLKIGKLSQENITDVFPLSGVPTITFVEPVSFKKLISSIKHKGRGIIIEGPSGIGKTSAIKKAIERIGLSNSEYRYLTARDPINHEAIKKIREWHNGIVIIDDFHRLEESIKASIADYLKLLADIETSNKKIIIIGIPNTGIKLISFGHDLATRIDIFEFSKVDSQRISELIEKGENALNIKFDKKSDIIIASNGSLGIAQYLCHYSAIEDDVFETQKTTKVISSNLADVVESVKKVVSTKFDDFVFLFSRLGGNKDRTSIKLLKELALTDNGTINLERFKNQRPELSNGIDLLLNGNLIEELWKKNKECKNFLFFDQVTSDLVIDDPQLLFYINNTTESHLSNVSGKKEVKQREKVFISYSHKDAFYFERLMVHLKPLFRDGVVDIWSDIRIKPGEKWNKEIERALEETKVAILLISADFLASDYINENELPNLIKASSIEGAVIVPVFLGPANLNRFENITQYQGVNSPNMTLIDMDKTEQEKLFVKLSQTIESVYNIA
ncbi:MAG: TIR domain-containing protein [Agriterribacter sp.]